MAKTVLNLINETFGSDDCAALAEQVRSGAAIHHVSDLLESWRQWAFEWSAPAAPPHSFRPYAFAHWRGDPTSGLSSLWQKSVGGSQELNNQIVHHLLYCDAIALPDPLFGQGAMTPLLNFPDLTSPEIERLSVAEVMSRVAPLAELIEHGVIVVVPYTDEPDVPTSMLPDLAAVADTVDKDFPQMPDDWLEVSYARRAAIDIVAQMMLGDGEFDAYLPTRAHIRLFHAMNKRVDAALHQVAGSALPGSRLFWRLLDCQLPDLASLPLKEVVAIRKSGEFEPWRRAVADGLLRAEALLGQDEDGLGFAEMDRREIGMSVQEAADKSVQSLRRSKEKKVNFGVDAVVVGGAMAATFLVPPLSTVLVGLAAFGPLSHLFLRWRCRRPGSFARHVEVFGNAAN